MTTEQLVALVAAKDAVWQHHVAYINSTLEPDQATIAAIERAAYERGKAEADALWSRNSRETFEAMCAMRDAINEHVPMPSLESDLLQGPEASVFCAAVAEAVVKAILTQEVR